MNRDLLVVVLMGGWSAEREVSLTSGKGVAAALRERGWSNVTELDMDRDVARRLAGLKPDIVFNALHGTPGEDGTVQGMMDLMGLKYTHSGLETSVARQAPRSRRWARKSAAGSRPKPTSASNGKSSGSGGTVEIDLRHPRESGGPAKQAKLGPSLGGDDEWRVLQWISRSTSSY
jgi:hypothetical protein